MKYLIVCIILFCSVFIANAAPPDTTKLPMSPTVRITKLPNGMGCYIVKNKKPEHRAEIRLVVNAGSLLEDDDQRGLAHLLEHLAFEGTKRFPEQRVIKFLEERGMTFGSHTNAYTSGDETVYEMQVPSDSAHVLATALDIVVDWAVALTMDSAAIEKERSIVIEEWRMRELGMQGRINTAFYKEFYHGSRHGVRLTIGTKSSLDTFHHEAVRRFYRDWYTPANMAVVVVGDIEPDTVQRLVQERLGTLYQLTPKRNVAQERSSMRLVPNDSIRAPRIVLHIDKELHTTVCETHWRTTADSAITHEDYRRAIVQSLALALINSRLNERAVSSAKPPFRRAYVQWNPQDRLNASTSLAVEPSAALFTSYEEALKDMRRILRDGFLPTEITRAKSSMLKSASVRFKERENTPSVSIAKSCVSLFLTGGSIVEPAYLLHLDTTMIANITAAELHQTAVRLFPIGQSQQLTFIGVPPQDSLGMTEESVRAVLARADTARIEPYQETTTTQRLLKNIPPLGKIVRERKYAKTGVTEWLLANGVRVLLKPTDFQQDQIVLQSSVEGGLSLAEKSQYLAAKMAAELQDPSLCGVGALSASELAKFLADKSVSIKPYTERLHHGINGSASAADLETMLQLFYAVHTTPRADSVSFLIAKERQLQAYSNRTNSPTNIYQDAIDSVLSDNHYTIRAATRHEIEQWQHIDSGYAFYKRLFQNMRGSTVTLVGAFDVERVKPLVVRYIGNIPTKFIPLRFRDEVGYPKSGKVNVTIHKGQDAQGYAFTAITGFMREWTSTIDMEADVLTEILNTKLRETLRNDAGGVYACEAGIQCFSQPRPRFVTSLFFPCEPNRVSMLRDRAITLLRDIKKGTITEQELRDAKAKLLADREPSMKDNPSWLTRITFWTRLGYSLEQVLEYNNVLAAITLPQLQQAANRFFDESNIGTFILLPEHQ
jgi:zinc protease